MASVARPLVIFLAAALGIAAPGMATAQQSGTPSQRAGNRQAETALTGRFETTRVRLEDAARGNAITRVRANALRRQIATAQRGMTRLAERQGFVSAAQLASYNRTLGEIDIELDGRGVARGYGDDALVGSR